MSTNLEMQCFILKDTVLKISKSGLKKEREENPVVIDFIKAAKHSPHMESASQNAEILHSVTLRNGKVKQQRLLSLPFPLMCATGEKCDGSSGEASL